MAESAALTEVPDTPHLVIPANAGIHPAMDTGLRRYDT
jgi:hypothetical protein